MKIHIFIISCFLWAHVSLAQDDFPVDNSLMGEESTVVDKVFPAIQIFNFHTTAILPKGEMKLTFAHRMGVLNTGVEGSFGLYQANSRFGADLGLTPFLTIGVGSTSQKKLYDGYVKFQLTKQSAKFPVETSIFSSVSFSVLKLNYPDNRQAPWQRMFYTSQLLISRSISKKLSVQLAGTYLHKNMVESTNDKNDIFSIGTAMNLRVTRMLYVAGEYVFLPKNQVVPSTVVQHIGSIGIQIHTGPRHVFQIFLSNSVGILPGTVISETQQKFKPKSLRISFNIPTTFKLF